MRRGNINLHNIMELQWMIFVLLLYFVDLTLQSHKDDMWDKLLIRFGVYHELPKTSHLAKDQGYKMTNDICKKEKFHGFLFVKDYEDTKALPIYDLNGFIAGLQALIPAKMKGYNSMNETIDLPPKEIQPPIFQVEFNGIQMYAITVYFKHPHLLCNPMPLKDSQKGKGLYIQNGTSPETDFIQIPLESKDLPTIWKPASCVPRMGRHYFMNLSRSLPCEKIYPVFLMYDSEDKLSAFGWSFQGKPMNLAPIKWFHLFPNIYPFIFDTKKLPSCMFHPKFSVFGLHIWLRDPHSELLKCNKIPPEKKTTPAVPWHKVTYKKEKAYSQIITVKPNVKHINNSNKLCFHNIVLIFIIFISRTFQWFSCRH